MAIKYNDLYMDLRRRLREAGAEDATQAARELEEMKYREIADSYGEVLVSALASDPTVCQVEFSFTVAHGLNRIYLTAHSTV